MPTIRVWQVRCAYGDSGRMARRPAPLPGAGPGAGKPRSGYLRSTSSGCHVFLDDVGPGPGRIEKLQLVGGDPLAGRARPEGGAPGEISGPVREYQFCHSVEVDRVVFPRV